MDETLLTSHIQQLRKIIQQRKRDPYEWYKRDLLRKRPNRKHGRDLYSGILSYRRRVGQREDRLCFRGVARIYNVLRMKAVRQHLEMIDKIPDLYMRFIGLRFPPQAFQEQLMARPKLYGYEQGGCLSCKQTMFIGTDSIYG